MNTYTEILSCDGTALYESDGQNLTFRTSGRMEVLLAYDGMIMLKLNDFEYAVNPSEEILYDNDDPQFEIVLHLKRESKGKWIFKINEHRDEVYSCLNQKCYLKQKSAKVSYSYSSSYSSKEQPASKVKKSKTQYYEQFDDDFAAEGEEKKQPLTIGSAVVTASKGLGWGLAFTGKIISKGLEAAGGLASKAVKPATEKVEVSQNAKANIELAKKTSKNVLQFTATQVGALFKFGKQTVSDIGERFEKSEKGKQMQENSKYEAVKSGTKTGVTAFANIYDGVVNAVYEIGSGISKGTSKVVATKYGDEAGQAANDLFEGAGNVVKVVRIPQDEAAKTFKQ